MIVHPFAHCTKKICLRRWVVLNQLLSSAENGSKLFILALLLLAIQLPKNGSDDASVVMSLLVSLQTLAWLQWIDYIDIFAVNFDWAMHLRLVALRNFYLITYFKESNSQHQILLKNTINKVPVLLLNTWHRSPFRISDDNAFPLSIIKKAYTLIILYVSAVNVNQSWAAAISTVAN